MLNLPDQLIPSLTKIFGGGNVHRNLLNIDTWVLHMWAGTGAEARVFATICPSPIRINCPTSCFVIAGEPASCGETTSSASSTICLHLIYDKRPDFNIADFQFFHNFLHNCCYILYTHGHFVKSFYAFPEKPYLKVLSILLRFDKDVWVTLGLSLQAA